MGKQEREKRNDFSWEDKQWKQPTKVKGEGNIFIPIFPQSFQNDNIYSWYFKMIIFTQFGLWSPRL